VAEAEAVRQAGSQADLCLPQHADPWLDHALEQDGIYQPTRSVAEGISKQKKQRKTKKTKTTTAGIFQPQKTRLKHFSNQKKQIKTRKTPG
jgi:hypothetical protein